MILQQGQVFRCVNPECAAEIKVTTSSISGDFAPKCCCGSVMKKRYSKPLLRIISENEPATRVFWPVPNRSTKHTSDQEGQAPDLC
jgi:hypothetical protein